MFHKNIAVISFLAKKCSKCGTVASNEYYFIGEISWTTYYRNLIDASLESRKFPPYCDYIFQISITTQLLITAYLLQFQWQISQEYNHVTLHWVKWLNFRNSKAKGLRGTYLTYVKTQCCSEINYANYGYSGFLIINLQKKEKKSPTIIQQSPTPRSPLKTFLRVLGVPNFHK